jgi:peptidoglycan/LPS O-acetylase OafA/YrhL
MSRKSSYSPQIDALRAIAIVVVMLHHYIKGPFLFAGFGVVMFFFLSGYFGTNALLRLKAKLETQAVTPSQALGIFYKRRYSRILPLHYLVLACAAVWGVAYARQTFFWNACFLSNFAMLHDQGWSGRFSQLWSLGVLEQFYLFWPVAILLLPRRGLIPLSLMGMGLAVVWRIVCLWAVLSPMAWTVVPFAGLDQLCTGALLAMCAMDPRQVVQNRLLGVSRLSAILFCVLMAGRALGVEAPFSALYLPLVASLAFAWVVNEAKQGFAGWAGVVLNLPILAHCGRISFAAFLLHNLTELMLPRSPHIRQLMATNYRFIVLVPLTFFVADVAWRFFENPLLNLRESGVALRHSWRNPRAVREAFAAPILDLCQKLALD